MANINLPSGGYSATIFNEKWVIFRKFIAEWSDSYIFYNPIQNFKCNL